MDKNIKVLNMKYQELGIIKCCEKEYE